MWSGRSAVLPGCGGERDDLPSAIFLVEIEEIPAAMIQLAIDIEVKGGPDHGQVVVDVDLRIVDALLDVRGPGCRYAIGPKLDGELAQDAILHHNENSAWEPGSLDGCSITMRHSIEHRLYWDKHSCFVSFR